MRFLSKIQAHLHKVTSGEQEVEVSLKLAYTMAGGSKLEIPVSVKIPVYGSGYGPYPHDRNGLKAAVRVAISKVTEEVIAQAIKKHYPNIVDILAKDMNKSCDVDYSKM